MKNPGLEAAARFRQMLRSQGEALRHSLRERGLSDEQAAAFLKQKRGMAPWHATAERLESWLDKTLVEWTRDKERE